MLQSACQSTAALTERETSATGTGGGNGHDRSPGHFGQRPEEGGLTSTPLSVIAFQLAVGPAAILPTDVGVGAPQERLLPLPADEGAGSYALQQPATDAAEEGSRAGDALAPAIVVAGPTSSRSASGHAGVPPAPDGPPPPVGVPSSNVEEVANEVLRLRLLRSQHEELRAQLSRAEGQLRRISPHALIQFRSYLERHSREAHLQSQVQEALIRLLECLLKVCRVEVGSGSPNWILNSARRLLRDPHSLTSKLCSMPHISVDETKGLAPFLLSSSPYRRVREKEVNDCYEALHSWLSAFYLLSMVSDQVAPTAQALNHQEWALRRLTGHALGSTSTPSGTAIAFVDVAGASARVSASASTGSGGAGWVGRGRATGTRATVTASPLARSRSTVQGAPPPPRAASASCRPAAAPGAATSTIASSFVPSRSPSPGSTRTVCTGSGASAGIMRTRGSSSMLSAAAARAVPPPRAATAGRVPGDGDRKPPSPGLSQCTSERVLARSPRTPAKKESRSPSVGIVRTSPSAPPPRTARSPHHEKPLLGRRSDASDRHMLSPSQSEGSLATVHGMTGAPAIAAADSGCGLQRSPAIRTKATPQVAAGSRTATANGRVSVAAARSAPGYGGIAHAADAPASARGRRSTAPAPWRKFQEKSGGAPRNDGLADATPLCIDSARDCASTRDNSHHSGDDDEDGHGPQRRRLSSQQYEALMRCAQQVVALNTAGSVAAPYRASYCGTRGSARSRPQPRAAWGAPAPRTCETQRGSSAPIDRKRGARGVVVKSMADEPLLTGN